MAPSSIWRRSRNASLNTLPLGIDLALRLLCPQVSWRGQTNTLTKRGSLQGQRESETVHEARQDSTGCNEHFHQPLREMLLSAESTPSFKLTVQTRLIIPSIRKHRPLLTEWRAPKWKAGASMTLEAKRNGRLLDVGLDR